MGYFSLNLRPPQSDLTEPENPPKPTQNPTNPSTNPIITNLKPEPITLPFQILIRRSLRRTPGKVERKESCSLISVHINLQYFISYFILTIKVPWAGHEPPKSKKKQTIKFLISSFFSNTWFASSS